MTVHRHPPADTVPPPDAARGTGSAGASELLQWLQSRLGPESSRRIGDAHVAVLQVLLGHQGEALPVIAIHQVLAAHGDAIKLSGVYRALEVLEEAQVVEHQWRTHVGRPVRVFRLADDLPPRDTP